MANKVNVYEIVTNRIIQKLEEAIANGKPAAPWHRPWNDMTAPVNYVSQKNYRGVNVMLLESGEYLTWKQLCDVQKTKPNVKLRKGSKSSIVVYFDFKDKVKDVVGDSGQIEQKTVKVPFLRYYNVFNARDVDGLELHERPTYKHEPISEAEAIVNGYIARENGLRLTFNDGQKACYRPLSDSLSVPRAELFPDVNEYYSVLFHELTHSTGHPSRLKRLKLAAFGDEAYSKEELVAEIGSSLLCASCGIDSSSVTDNSVAYLQSWLSALKNDVTLIVSAAAKAQKAADYIRGVDMAANH